ncbi:MAG: hypothetical protein IT376_13195 [Polyangiaceae bacterium]|nr:hypothetical protein [Polyangiaceae bacterium]
MVISIIACSSEPARVDRACRVPSFRSCEDPCGKGVAECIAPGEWGPCSCTVIDSGFADPDGSDSADSGSDAATADARVADGAADSPPTDGTDAAVDEASLTDTGPPEATPD